jgi:hypothetical protein
VNMVLNFGLYKMLGSSRMAAQLAAPQERLSSVSKEVTKYVYIYILRPVSQHISYHVAPHCIGVGQPGP